MSLRTAVVDPWGAKGARYVLSSHSKMGDKDKYNVIAYTGAMMYLFSPM